MAHTRRKAYTLIEAITSPLARGVVEHALRKAYALRQGITAPLSGWWRGTYFEAGLSYETFNHHGSAIRRVAWHLLLGRLVFCDQQPRPLYQAGDVAQTLRHVHVLSRATTTPLSGGYRRI